MIHSEEDLRKLLKYKEDINEKIPFNLLKKISAFNSFNILNLKNLFFDKRFKTYSNFKNQIIDYFTKNFEFFSKKQLIPFDEKKSGILIPKYRSEEEENRLNILQDKNKNTGEKKRKTLKDFMKKKKEVDAVNIDNNEESKKTIKLGAIKNNKRMTFVYMDDMRRSPFFKWAVKSDEIYSYKKIDLVPDYDFCSSDIDEYISGETLESDNESSDEISNFSDFLEEKYINMKRGNIKVPFLNTFDLEMEILSEENIEKWKKLPLLKSTEITEKCIEDIEKALKENITYKKIAETLSRKYNIVFEKILSKIREINKKF